MELFEFDGGYLDRLRAGDAATVAHFVAYFNQLLRMLLRARMLPPDRVDDLTQETFQRVLVALRREGAVKQPERFGAFVNSICKNTLHEYERSGKRLDPIDGGHYEIPDHVPDAFSDMVTRESRELVRKVLDGLPSKDRDLLREIFFLEKDKDEICRERGVDREYLRVLVHRAKTRFREDYDAQRCGKRGASDGEQKG